MKRYLFIVLHLFVVLLFFACNNRKPEFRNSYEKFLIKDVSFNISVDNFNHLKAKVFTDNDKEYLLFFNIMTNKIFIYNQDDFQLFFETNIDFPNERIIDICINSFDEIYFLSENKKIIKTDTLFKANKIFDINFASSQWIEGYDIDSDTYGTDFRVIDGIAYFDHYPLYIIKNLEIALDYCTKKIGVGFNLYDTACPVQYSSGFPSNYKKYFYRDYHPYRIFANDLEIASFKACDTIFIKNVKTAKKYTKVLRSIKRRKFVPIDFDSSTNNIYIMTKYFTEHFKYADLRYSKHKDRYYRAVYHGAPFENPDGTVANTRVGKESMIIADNGFNIIDEIDFDDKYILSYYIPTKNGILIVKNCYENYEDPVREKIIFSLFDI